MEKKYLTLREIQIEETNILRQIVEFCQKHDITYYLCGGTLLGAIRHQGFIPWDDDIDIIMTRPEFERFEKIAQEEVIGPSLKLLAYDYGTLPLPFAKVVNTVFHVDYEIEPDELERYLWVDIFTFDGLPDSEQETAEFYRKVIRKRKDILLLSVSEDNLRLRTKDRKSLRIKQLIRFFIRGNLRTKLIQKKAKEYDALVKNYDYSSSKYIGGVNWGYGPQERMLRDHIDSVDVEFEGMLVSGLKNYDEYLGNLYGDYMKLPPENQRFTHQIKIYRTENSAE